MKTTNETLDILYLEAEPHVLMAVRQSQMGYALGYPFPHLPIKSMAFLADFPTFIGFCQERGFVGITSSLSELSAEWIVITDKLEV